ncbi:hypothetical protein BH18ACT4_BH18ACT4_09790 [soil metagenome]
MRRDGAHSARNDDIVKTYTAQWTRAGRWLNITVPEVPGAQAQARRLGEVEDLARGAIAVLLDVPPDSFSVTVRGIPPKRASSSREMF